ncbi:MAG: TonB-dependent receptor [Gammaproteobacteria bacterium]|nr:TonB-dependent receptor [Gammaproteobacteria bacterium]
MVKRRQILAVQLAAAISLTGGVPQATYGQQARGMLEEVVVTAQRREERLQDVPIAVTAFSRENLETRGLTNLTQIEAFTPNVTLDSTTPFSGSSQILGAYIRGIGQQDFAFNLEPGVGVYVDGVYYARSVGAVVDLLDLERIEVLKGPQGTLFGRNTIGGALNITTRKPADEFQYRADVTLGRFDRMDLRGSVDVPLIDNVLLSQVSVSSKNRDGYQHRIPFPGTYVSSVARFHHADRTTGDEQGGEDVQNGRAKLLWRASDAVEFLVTGDYTHADEQAAASTLLDGTPLPANLAGLYNTCISLDAATLAGIGLGAACGPMATIGTSLAGVNADATTSNDKLPYDNRFLTKDIDTSYAAGLNFSKIDTWGITGALSWDLNETIALKSISSWRELDSKFGTDIDGSPMVINDPSFSMNQEQLSQELQLTGLSFEDRLKWLLGFYYFHEEGNLTDFPTFAEGLLQIVGPNDFDHDSYALFTHLNYQLLDRLSFTVGLRYTYENKHFTGGQRDLNALAFKLGLPLALHPDPSDPTLYYPPGENVQSFNDLSKRFGVEYRFNDEVMSYFSYAEGFKSGGWTTRLTQPGLTAPAFGPETATTYELGLKSDLFDRRLRLNLAAFYTDYADLQVTVQRGISPWIENAGTAEIKGFEAEFVGLVTDDFQLSGALGYLDAEYTEIDPTATVKKDSMFVNTPEWSATIAGDYTLRMKNGAAVLLHLDYAYRDETANDAENTPLLMQSAIDLVNASLSYRPAGETWEVVLGGRNLTDERYIMSGFNQVGIGHIDATYSRPREWYVTLRVMHD